MEDYLPHLFVLVGVGILALLTYHAVRGAKSKSWPTTPGVLLKKGTREHISTDRQTGTVKWSSIHADVEYSYQVDGVEYTSKRATFSDMVVKPMSALNRLLDDFLKTDRITVYYNPKKPADSVLIPGASIWNFTPMLVGFGFMAGGVFVLLQ